MLSLPFQYPEPSLHRDHLNLGNIYAEAEPPGAIPGITKLETGCHTLVSQRSRRQKGWFLLQTPSMSVWAPLLRGWELYFLSRLRENALSGMMRDSLGTFVCFLFSSFFETRALKPLRYMLAARLWPLTITVPLHKPSAPRGRNSSTRGQCKKKSIMGTRGDVLSKHPN